MWDTIKAKALAALTSQLTLHTAQALSAVITAAAVDVPALSHGQLDVTSFSQLAAGVLMQTATWAIAHYVVKAKA